MAPPRSAARHVPRWLALVGVALLISQVVRTYQNDTADPQIVTAGVGLILYPLIHRSASRLRDEDGDDE